jgi:glycosyltransferase involved in cell wall biosynthesis
MPSRILLVSNFFPPRTVGGAEIVAFREARALAARGHQVVILAGVEPSEQAPSGTLNFETYEGLPLYRLSMRSLGPDLNFHWPSAARRMKAVIASHGIQVVHFHNVTGLGANLLPMAKSYGARCISTIHDHWGFCYRNTLLRDNGATCANHEECAGCLSQIESSPGLRLPIRMRRDYVAWSLRQADRLLFPSAYLASAYRRAGFPGEQLTVLSNGIDLDRVKPGPKSADRDARVKFLWSGYLGEHKGILVFLDALTRLAQDRDLISRWHVTIAGEGHLRPRVEGELKARNLTTNVELRGRLPRPELLDILRTTDVSVLSSIWPENEPVTLLEAIACGTAQIATRIGGSMELVEDGCTGLLVEPGDASGLAAAMQRYILDPSLAAAHGMKNLERREDFDESHTIDALEAILTNPPGPDAARVRDPVIVCGISSPTEQVRALLDRVHEHVPVGLTPRFLWHEWLADGLAWKQADLLWLWDKDPSESLINLALRRGVPVLAPITDWTEGLSRHYAGVILYRTYLEALAALRSLLSVPTLRGEFSWGAQAASIPATVLAPRRAFALRSEAGG